MAKRIKGNRKDFTQDRDILTFRPTIDFVEPEQIEGEKPKQPTPEATLSEIKSNVKDIIDGYKNLDNLLDLAQERVDQRSQGLEINLDPIVDSHIIDAIKRQFPDKVDPTKLTFDDYKKSLSCINTYAQSKIPDTTLESSLNSSTNFDKLDLTRTNFAGFGKIPGMNRPELDSTHQVVEPIDIPSFQAKQIKTLFDMLTPMITDLVKSVAHV